jgi:hypothetical protein
MTNTMTSQNIDLSFWDTWYTLLILWVLGALSSALCYCSLVDRYRCLRGTYPAVGGTCSSVTLVPPSEITWHHVREDWKLDTRCCDYYHFGGLLKNEDFFCISDWLLKSSALSKISYLPWSVSGECTSLVIKRTWVWFQQLVLISEINNKWISK